MSYAQAAMKAGQWVEAEKQFQALQAMTTRFGSDDRRRGIILTTVADFFRARGRYDDALPLYGEAVEIFQNSLRHMELLVALNNLAVLFGNLGNYAESTRAYRRALAVLDKHQRNSIWVRALVFQNLAANAIHLNQLEEAEDWLGHAEATLRKAWFKKKLVHGYILSNRARISVRLGQPEVAEQQAREALTLLHKVPQTSYVPRGVLAYALLRQGRFQEGEPLARQAFQEVENIAGSENPIVVPFVTTLASICAGLDRVAEAETLFQRAVALHQHWRLPPLLDWADSLADYARLLRRLGRDEEAQTWEAQVREIREPEQAILISDVPVVELPKKIDERFTGR